MANLPALDAPGGCVLIGAVDDPRNYVRSSLTAAVCPAGVVTRSSAVEVPRKSRFVSFEIRATPRGGGAGTLTVKIRTANRAPAVSTDALGDTYLSTTPAEFTAITATATHTISIDADAGFAQLEVTPAAGADFDVIAIAVAKGS